MMQKKHITTLLFILVCDFCIAQNSVVISGKIADVKNQGIANVSVIQVGTNNATITNNKGIYSIDVEYDDSCVLEYSNLAYEKKRMTFYSTNKMKLFKDIELILNENTIENVNITATKSDKVGTSIIKGKDAEYFPNPTGDVGTVVKTLGQGVQSNNELSGQYSVRGGNYDENLVYVNDFVIYRPFLTSSGQQEC